MNIKILMGMSSYFLSTLPIVMVIYTHIGVGLRRCSFRLRWAILRSLRM